MSKKPNVLLVLGSPRKNANSSLLGERIAEGAESQGAKIKEIVLQDYEIRPCKACEGCHGKKMKGCVIKDDMRKIYPLVEEADAYIFASPIYWFHYSAQLKLFIDRCYALFNPSTLASPFGGKSYALAFAYGANDPFEAGCVNAIRTFQDGFSGFLKSKMAGAVYASAMEQGELKKDKEVLEKAFALGVELMK